TKPFQVEEVLARVEHQLTIRRLSKQLQEQNQKLQQEIQERLKAEQAAAAASKAKSEFLANMSHELRTPLNAILGFTQVMTRDPDLNPEQREHLGIINRSGEHLLELINDVLDLSKIEAGIISLYESNCDLYRLLDNLEEMFQIKAEQKNLQLVFIVPANVPQYVKTDAKKLRVCLINLLGNAIKFTEHGTVALRVSVAVDLVTAGGETGDSSFFNRLYFEVEDTGPGIAPQEINNLFDAFVQTETGRKSAEGTGLGLTITRKFVQLMGGDITVRSIVGEGTTFRFDIKIAEADSPEIITKPLTRVVGLEPNQGLYRILVVDDTKENRLLLVKLLEPMGFEVREAENGVEGVAWWESWQPQLIWMDTRMPVMDGLEATRQIRSRERGKATQGENSASSSSLSNPDTIIIALTASAFEERRGEILAAGSDDFVRKPFTEEVIFEKIGQYLGVRYVYEDLPPLTRSGRRVKAIDEKSDLFFVEKFSAMPPSWVEQLYQAANQVNEELVLQLIREIPKEEADLAEALMDLCHDFRLDIIVRLTQLVRK
ncbi:MAG TPA: hybrid sensor histidine kinase/response regulator, partial [Cyanobacteria bacterium UBA8803]|nr:hybrid sensor histidine kinase/response regulator [Cyanobacteria bacterium UBA8803]